MNNLSNAPWLPNKTHWWLVCGWYTVYQPLDLYINSCLKQFCPSKLYYSFTIESPKYGVYIPTNPDKTYQTNAINPYLLVKHNIFCYILHGWWILPNIIFQGKMVIAFHVVGTLPLNPMKITSKYPQKIPWKSPSNLKVPSGKVTWLVVFRNPSEKYEFVNWDD